MFSKINIYQPDGLEKIEKINLTSQASGGSGEPPEPPDDPLVINLNPTFIQEIPKQEDRFSLSIDEEDRARRFIESVAIKAFKKINTQNWQNKSIDIHWRRNRFILLFEEIFINIIKKSTKEILNAAKQKPAAMKALKDIENKRKSARKELSDSLKTAREKLRVLNLKINNAELLAEKIVNEKAKEHRRHWAAKLLTAKRRNKQLSNIFEKISNEIFYEAHEINKKSGNLYPPIPTNMNIPPSVECFDIPKTSGIYFLWKNDAIVYVGMAKILSNRLRLGSHHVLRSDHSISYILFDYEFLRWAECYYIGITQSILNFGQSSPRYDPQNFLIYDDNE